MVLDPYQNRYFIEQVGLAAASFGVSKEDVQATGAALTKLFDYRCSPKTTIVPAQGPQYQSICTDPSCLLAMNSTCMNQPTLPQPLVANASLADGEGRNASSTATMTASATAVQQTTNAAFRALPEGLSLLSALAMFFAW